MREGEREREKREQERRKNATTKNIRTIIFLCNTDELFFILYGLTFFHEKKSAEANEKKISVSCYIYL